MEKLRQKLLTLLIILLPVQLGRHFWPNWSYLWGLRIDYLSPTIYFTDLLVFAILGLWGIEGIRNKELGIKKTDSKKILFLSLFVIFLISNCFSAQTPGVAFYKAVKIIELTLLGFYLAKNKNSLFHSKGIPQSGFIRNSLFIPIVYSSLIAIGQFFKQGSLNGLFWWLGERTFIVATPGIAKTVINGQIFLRPYATFPHPNVLAGFLLVALVLADHEKILLGWKKAFSLVAMFLGSMAILLSFSRSVWLMSVLVSGWLLFRNLVKVKAVKNYWRLAFLGWLILLGGLIFFSFRLPAEEAFGQRIQLAQSALLMIKSSPLVGVGLNNFLTRLPEFWPEPGTFRLFQPVHNIFLLVTAETGLIGLAVFIWFLYLTVTKLFREKKFIILNSLFVILLLGLVDHYWLTLQQTQLLFAIVLGLSWGKTKVI